MTGIVPTKGRIVYYTIPRHVADEINRRRKHAYEQMDYHRWKKNGTMVHVGNTVEEGQIVPAMIVAVWGTDPHSAVNLQLMLDGSDTYWVTSTNVEDPKGSRDGVPIHTPGHYHWMDYQKGQAAKNDGELTDLKARLGLLEAAFERHTRAGI